MREQLRRQVKAAIRRGDMDRAWFLVGIIVLLPKDMEIHVSQ
jgi:hypothetical protein